MKGRPIEKTIFAGKRKTAVAKLRLTTGSGNIFYNGLPHTELGLFHKLALLEPIRVFNQEFGSDIKRTHIQHFTLFDIVVSQDFSKQELI